MSDNFAWYVTGAVLVVWYLSTQAGRLDRLHHRIEVSLAALDGHLNRRAGISAELVSLNFLDPASEAYLMQSAHDVLAGADLPDESRLSNEGELTEALVDAFEDAQDVAEFRKDPAIALLLDELVEVGNRVQLAKRFHGEAVNDCRTIRSQLLVRTFHLAGRAKLPEQIDLDDRIPAGL